MKPTRDPIELALEAGILGPKEAREARSLYNAHGGETPLSSFLKHWNFITEDQKDTLTRLQAGDVPSAGPPSAGSPGGASYEPGTGGSERLPTLTEEGLDLVPIPAEGITVPRQSGRKALPPKLPSSLRTRTGAWAERSTRRGKHVCERLVDATRRREGGNWPPRAMPPGSQVGRFVICDILGVGGMGEVYLVWQADLGVHRALKRIRLDRASDAAFDLLFEREVRVLARLEHPGIVQLYDVVREGPVVGYTMAFVAGHSLAAELRRRRMDWRRAAGVVAQVAEALGAAHDRGVVHRDIKPENILLADGGRALVTDFGIAHLDEDADSEETAEDPKLTPFTRDFTVRGAGTYPFMAPEQWNPTRYGRATPRADVWALGVLLHVCCYGKTPFDGTPAQVKSRVLHGKPVLPDSFPDGPPRGLRAIIARCLQRDPADRYAQGAELAQTIRSYIETGHVEDLLLPRPYRLLTRAKGMLRTHRRVVALGLLLLCILGVNQVLRSRERVAEHTARTAKAQKLLDAARGEMETARHGPPDDKKTAAFQAEKMYREAMAIAPDLPDVRRGLGECLLLLVEYNTDDKAFDVAEYMLEQARDIVDPGVYFARKDELNHAMKQRRVEIDRIVGEAFMRLAQQGLGKDERTDLAFRLAAERDPHTAGELLKRLETEEKEFDALQRRRVEDGVMDDEDGDAAEASSYTRQVIVMALGNMPGEEVFRALQRRILAPREVASVKVLAAGALVRNPDPAARGFLARAWFRADAPTREAITPYFLRSVAGVAGEPEDVVAAALAAVREERAAKDYEEALLSVDRVLVRNPRNPDLYHERGEVFRAMGRFEDAAIEFSIALAIDPRRLDSRKAVAACRLDLVERLIRPGAAARKGAAEEARRQADLALAVLDVEKDPARPDIDMILLEARAYAARGEWSIAVGILDRAEGLRQAARKVLPLKVRMLRSTGDLDGALSAVRRVAARDEAYLEARLAECMLLAELRERDAAIEIVDETLHDHPDSMQVRFVRALLLLRAGRASDCIAELDLIHRGVAESWRDVLLIVRGLALLDAGRDPEARDVLEGLASPRERDLDFPVPDFVLGPERLELLREFYVRRGRQRRIHGEAEGALDDIDSWLLLVPSSVDALVARARILWKLQQQDAALRALDTALVIDPLNPEAHYHRGRVLAGMKRFGESEKAFGRAASLGFKDPEAAYWEGRKAFEGGRDREAEERCSYFLDRAEDSPYRKRALAIRSRARSRLGMAESAERDAREALKLDEELSEAWEALGEALMALDRPGDAADAFARVLRAKTDDVDGLYRLARARALSGDPDAALGALRRIVSLGRPMPPGAEEDPAFDTVRDDPRFAELFGR